MIVYGNASMADLVVDRDNFMVYNLTSLAERYSKAKLPLVPPNNLGASSEYEFDVRYMQWILGNDINFYYFMNIIKDTRNGLDVFIVISEDEWSLILIESLTKLIQQRYGINAGYIKTEEDLYYTKESDIAEGYGIMNYDQDIERFAYLEMMNDVRTGKVNKYDLDI